LFLLKQMVQLNLFIRPQRGYNVQCPNSIKHVTVDSSDRLEDILASVKIDKKGTFLYSSTGLELPLNSSLASHNVQNGDIIETCSSPLLATILSAVISDLDAVEKLDEDHRSQDRIASLLDNPSLTESDWLADRWSVSNVKRRGIQLKLIKNALERKGRHASLKPPPCNSDLHSLYKFIEESGVITSMTQCCFKPAASNRNGLPSVCWELMEQKLHKFHTKVCATDYTAATAGEDFIETFVRLENIRHNVREIPPRNPTKTVHINDNVVNSMALQSRPSRTLPIPNRINSKMSSIPLCVECKSIQAASMCLVENCPFYEKATCLSCFRANHPIASRDHEPLPMENVQVKKALRALKRASKAYCPEFASGAFAILCALYEAQQQKQQYHLEESDLKARAQPRCRANLYDRQARGRDAFAAMDSLREKGYVRCEIIPSSNQEKISLTTKGEELAKLCFEFESSVEAVVKCCKPDFSDQKEVEVVIDTREDPTFAKRFLARCRDRQVVCKKRELPAGDYIFMIGDKVMPVIVERKTWSDFADSIAGRGQQGRLECLRLQRTCDTSCQLCRMKRSQCDRIIFIIEGSRCLNRNSEPNKCTEQTRCKYCKDLHTKHSKVHEDLEKVIYQLQVDHQCIVHFTRDYNETITSLFCLREILGSATDDDDDLAKALALSKGQVPFSLPKPFTYSQFHSNAQSRQSFTKLTKKRGKIHEIRDEEFIKILHSGTADTIFHDKFSVSQSNHVEISNVCDDANRSIIEIDSDNDSLLVEQQESQNSILILDNDSWKNPQARDTEPNSEVIVLDESHNLVQILDGAALASSAKRSSTAPSIQGINHNDQEHNETMVSLLFLSGLYEYDNEYQSDVTKGWKELYQNSESNQSNFIDLGKQILIQMQMGSSPLVKRESIIFWILFIQLRYNVLIHTSRQQICIDTIRSLWDDSALWAERPHSVNEDVKGTNNSALKSLTSSSELKSLNRVPECCICLETLGGGDVEALPCGHCFHKNCVQLWLNRSNSRSCPSCKCSVYSPKDERATVRRPKMFHQLLDVCDPVEAADKERMREARLHRFSAVPSGLATTTSATSRKWKCLNCTFENDPLSITCKMECEETIIPVASKTPQKESRMAQTSVLTDDMCAWSRKRNLDTPIRTQKILKMPRSMASTTSITSAPTRTTCGACKCFGHNRSNYTAQTCEKYNDPEEIKLRRAKREQQEQKSREADAKLNDLDIRDAQLEQLPVLMAQIQSIKDAASRSSEKERKRLEREKAQAEKKARKFIM